MLLEAIADPQHAMDMNSIFGSNLAERTISRQQWPIPLLSKRISKAVLGGELDPFAADRGCSYHFGRPEFLDDQAEGTEVIAKLAHQFRLEEKIGHCKCIGQLEQGLQQGASFQIDDDGRV